MKWQFNKANSSKSLPASSSLLIGLIICLIGSGIFLSANASLFKRFFSPTSSQESLPTVDEIAAKISVKILDQEFLGSGFLVQQRNNNYVVITNQHVLRAGDAPYSIQTSDGQIHRATVINTPTVPNDQYDLAVLEFESDLNYTVAKIGSSLYLEVGEPVFAAGFPYSALESENGLNKHNSATIKPPSQTEQLPGLSIKKGRIAIILNQALVEGYQIGYTNDVKKGMSGGALLNSRGEVVGINGKHAYPLWESPELYQDGSQPCPALEKLITRSSLAIPIEKGIELDPQLVSLRAPSDVATTRQLTLETDDSQVVEQMQAEVQATNQSCENYGADSLDSSNQEAIRTESLP